MDSHYYYIKILTFAPKLQTKPKRQDEKTMAMQRDAAILCRPQHHSQRAKCEAPAHPPHRGPMAGGHPWQPRGAAWSDGHPKHMVQWRTMGLGDKRQHSLEMPQLLRETLHGTGEGALRRVPTAHGPLLDQRPLQAKSG